MQACKLNRRPNMRLMHIISGTGAGGSKQVFLDYQMTLHELGYDIIACVRNRSHTQQRLQQLNFPTHVMRYSRFMITKRVKNELIQLHHTIAPDWLVVHNSKDAKLWRMLLPQASIVLVIHSNDFSGIKYVNMTIAVNPTLQNEVTATYHTPCLLIPNGLLVKPSAHPPRTGPDIVFGYLGKMRKSKGIFLLITALSKLSATQNWSVVIQGEGHLKYLIHAWALMLGVHRRIEWRPWHDTHLFFQDIDILVVPSFKETFGLVILEALMHNRKIVSTHTPGPSWIMTTLGLQSNLCPINSNALAALLKTACQDKDALCTITPDAVWKHYGEPVFKKTLHDAFKHYIV